MDIALDPVNKDMSAQEVVHWYQLYGRPNRENSYERLKEIVNGINCDDWVSVVTECPRIFSMLEAPDPDVCKAAVSAHPANIRFVKNPPDELTILALSLDMSCARYRQVTLTDKVCKALKLDRKKDIPSVSYRYPAPYYLVSFHENLADEGSLYHHKVMTGIEVERFLKGSFHIHFGNINDSGSRNILKRANVMALTQEEYNVLRKLNLLYINSGYFSFDEYDDEF